MEKFLSSSTGGRACYFSSLIGSLWV